MGIESLRRRSTGGTGPAPGKELWGKYVGLVRDVNDPEQRGRVRFHCPEVMADQDREENWLHWALPSYPIGGGIDAGTFLPPPGRPDLLRNGEELDTEEDPEARVEAPEGIRQQDIAAWIEFRHGDVRFPIYTGFFYYSPEDLPNYIPALARGEGDETTLPPVGSFRTQNFTADETGDVSQGADGEEPEPQYSALYPFNRVYKSPGGHVVEFDDTPSEERIRVYHRSGSYMEFTNSGLVTKVQGQLLQFITEDIVRATTASERRITKGDLHEQVEGFTTRLQLGGSRHVYRDRAELFYRQSVLMNAIGAMEIQVGNYNLQSGGNIEATAAGGMVLGAQKLNMLGLLSATLGSPAGVELIGTLPATFQMLNGTLYVTADQAFLGSIQTASAVFSTAIGTYVATLPPGSPAQVAWTALGTYVAALSTAAGTKQAAANPATVLTLHRLSQA